jgi:hypothetical protein
MVILPLANIATLAGTSRDRSFTHLTSAAFIQGARTGRIETGGNRAAASGIARNDRFWRKADIHKLPGHSQADNVIGSPKTVIGTRTFSVKLTVKLAVENSPSHWSG